MSSSPISLRLRPKWHFSAIYEQALPAPPLGPQAQMTLTDMQNGTQAPPRHANYGTRLQLCNRQALKNPLLLHSPTPTVLEFSSGPLTLAPHPLQNNRPHPRRNGKPVQLGTETNGHLSESCSRMSIISHSRPQPSLKLTKILTTSSLHLNHGTED